MARLAAVGVVIFAIAAMVVHYRTGCARLAYRLSQVQRQQMLLARQRFDLQIRIAALRGPGQLQTRARGYALSVVPPTRRGAVVHPPLAQSSRLAQTEAF